ncbi:uncharacterized protein LOC142598087 [Dermatophagoides farinae]|uniref:uncharacterized protein LOC142598087 n=1 Tax=Dermatophagoides farinae TaxID=6954 RepID=UPI003F62654B
MLLKQNNLNLINNQEYVKDEITEFSRDFSNDLLSDNPHHILGIVNLICLGNYEVRVIINDSKYTIDELISVNEENKDNFLHYKDLLGFLMERDNYRMNWLANALVNPGLVTWTMTKVLNMSTLFRELEAIKECTKYEGVSLIQGPPGTGKTSTISGVIRLVNQNLAKNTKKILICAPSNAAVDEIMRRLVSDPRLNGGIYNKKGTLYTPNVIRIGSGYHKELKKWSLNERLSQLKSVGKMISIDHFSRKLIQESSIICCTLSIAGSRVLTPFIGAIDTVIVDEASQCVEASNLIPLKLDPKRVILVGDPKQLPATVFSVVALSLNYDRSLFQRLQELNFKIVLLQTQYRMHPRISAFPNNKFYKGQLKDAHDLVNSLKPLIDYYKLPLFAPLVFINISGVETKSTNSYINVLEVQSHGSWMNHAGVITPYAKQVLQLRKSISTTFGFDASTTNNIDVNTVDSFQGREKNYVIFSAVRAQYSIGFLADKRRLNVALTRARLNLWVVGNVKYLCKNPLWSDLIKFCEEQNTIINVDLNQYKTGIHLWFIQLGDTELCCRA